jgi:hypothetical protein
MVLKVLPPIALAECTCIMLGDGEGEMVYVVQEPGAVSEIRLHLASLPRDFPAGTEVVAVRAVEVG